MPPHPAKGCCCCCCSEQQLPCSPCSPLPCLHCHLQPLQHTPSGTTTNLCLTVVLPTLSQKDYLDSQQPEPSLLPNLDVKYTQHKRYKHGRFKHNTAISTTCTAALHQAATLSAVWAHHHHATHQAIASSSHTVCCVGCSIMCRALQCLPASTAAAAAAGGQ